jgi:hypothetical protein
MTSDRSQAPTCQPVAFRGNPHGRVHFHNPPHFRVDTIERAKSEYVDGEINEIELEQRLETLLDKEH